MDAALEIWPDMAFAARANRAFLGHAGVTALQRPGWRRLVPFGSMVTFARRSAPVMVSPSDPAGLLTA